MATGQRQSQSRRTLGVATVVAIVLTLGVGLVASSEASPSTPATRVSRAATARPELARPGWTVAARSARGVMTDYRNVNVGGVIFRALRLRARTTLLRWHVGSADPNGGRAPRDAGPAIDWPSEGRPGVLAVFNGGFKAAAGAGGAVADGVRFWPLVRGRVTLAISATGHWAMGLWGARTFPPRGFRAISYRQNLVPLVWRGAVTVAARAPNSAVWGSPLGNVAAEPRTGLGLDSSGNLIYVATMHPVLPVALARALVAAGAVTAMELDINPYWPILGASFAPLHAAGGSLPVQLPSSEHHPTIYESGWTRDFFVALAEPPNWHCAWSSRGVMAGKNGAQPQPLVLRGRACNGRVRPPSPTTTSPSPTTTSTPTSATTSTAAS